MPTRVAKLAELFARSWPVPLDLLAGFPKAIQSANKRAFQLMPDSTADERGRAISAVVEIYAADRAYDLFKRAQGLPTYRKVDGIPENFPWSRAPVEADRYRF